jgi:hypothetical protein
MRHSYLELKVLDARTDRTDKKLFDRFYLIKFLIVRLHAVARLQPQAPLAYLHSLLLRAANRCT